MPSEDLIDKILPENEIIVTSTHLFTDEYKQECFLTWYNAGKPGATDFNSENTVSQVQYG